MELMIQPKVTGYRQLSEAEVALMNEGKALAEQCGAWIEKLRLHPSASAPPVRRAQDWTATGPALDQYWRNRPATGLHGRDPRHRATHHFLKKARPIMKYECKAVADFHRACDVPVREEVNIPAIRDEEIRLRLRLCNEEPRELMQALVAGDLVEVADGIADTMVVTAGTCVQLGVYPQAEHAAAAAISLVQGAHEILTRAIAATNFDDLAQSAEIMHIVCMGVAAVFGVPYRSVFDVVHESNMAKVDPTTGKVVKDKGGKVLKPTQWPEPQAWEPPTERIRALLAR